LDRERNDDTGGVNPTGYIPALRKLTGDVADGDGVIVVHCKMSGAGRERDARR
jgi:hypothetical protein